MRVDAPSTSDMPLKHDGHVTSKNCWCSPLRDDKADGLWIHYDAIHPSHQMTLHNGSLNAGVWSGTWRCTKCHGADFRSRDGSRTTQARLNSPCSREDSNG